ncbi:MAG: hypothetical protein D3910_23415, partial [Candidatus Electrothrix sp. ATG2]|nr:hypothetical protein [Candidatus Electrothrix sp. ATG2]
ALSELKADFVVPAAIIRLFKELLLRDDRAMTLVRMNVSFPEFHSWQEKQLKVAQQEILVATDDAKVNAAYILRYIFTNQSVKLLDGLLLDKKQNVVETAAESIGFIGEYHPGLVKTQTAELLNFVSHNNLELRRTAITTLGQIISFRGKETVADLPDLEQSVHAALRKIIFDSQQDLATRHAALDALGATGRPDCAEEIYELLKKLDKKKNDSLRYRCLSWLGRMAYTPAHDDAENELKKLTREKADWRKQRDSEEQADASAVIEKNKEDKIWRKEHWEYMLGNSLARMKPASTGIKLLNHPLYQVRQGAIRALASRVADRTDGAELIGKIIKAHQTFDPDDLPSPFPYTAFQAIDLALWNLEYTGNQNDLDQLTTILDALKEKNCTKTSQEGKIMECLEWTSNIPGQEGAIEERLEWTIDRLEEKLKPQEGKAPLPSSP